MNESFPDGDDCVYLLRCRYEPSGTGGMWRFRLENPRTGWRQSFGRPELLVAFLRRALVSGPSPSAAGQERP